MSSNLAPGIPSAVATFLPLLEQVGEGVQVFDEQGCLLYANEMAAKNLGFATQTAFLKAHHDRFCGLQIVSFCTTAGMPLALDDYPCVQALKGKRVAEQTLHFRDRQQRDRCLAIQAMPLRDDDGTVRYGAVLSRDLTASQAIAQKLEQKTRQLRQLVDVVPSLVACLDAQEHHIYANEAYLKAFRTKAVDLPGSLLSEIIGPVLYQQLQVPLGQALQGEIADICVPIDSWQTRLQYSRVSIIPQLEGQAVTGVYLIFSQIAAHKHTNDLLQTETNFFRHSLEAASVGTWDWHLIHQELLWSSPQEQLFGLTPGSFDGRPETFFKLVHEEDHDELKEAIAEAMHTHQQFAAEFRVKLPNQNIRWLSQRGQVLRNSEGQVVRMVGVTFDTTAQHTAQALLVQQMQRDRLIAKLSQDISRTDQVGKALPGIFEAVRQHLELDRLVLIDLREDAGKVIAEAQTPAVESMFDWKMRHPWSVKAVYLEKFKLGHPVGIADVQQQPLSEAELSFLKFFDVQADLSIPLLDGEQLWGLLSAQSQQPRDWLPEEIRLLETVGMLVSTAIERDRLHAYLTRANRKLKRFAYLDGLTQVANRRRFEHFLHQEWRRLMREQSPMALIMVDIDHFKAYNDVYGHQAGDDCLRRVAGILRSAVQRPADIVARYGGEEFAVVLPNTDVEGAETIAEKIRVLIHRAQIPHKGSLVSKSITLSIGLAALYPHPLKMPDDLIKLADKALYQAKENGRDRIVAAPAKPRPH
ncbi:sensor domain-containing diguanylate cyclase [Leptolyngbya iicbica]|nr:diguanylate cyclase [Leptolyngbya sp. LK]